MQLSPATFTIVFSSLMVRWLHATMHLIMVLTGTRWSFVQQAGSLLLRFALNMSSNRPDCKSIRVGTTKSSSSSNSSLMVALLALQSPMCSFLPRRLSLERMALMMVKGLSAMVGGELQQRGPTTRA
jgi:hypothetical protein